MIELPTIMTERRFSYPASHRLRGKLAFAAVYDAGVREARGPVTIFALRNDLPHPRLGLSVSRRVGNAPRRNTIKRKLRETFRLMQHDFPAGYDWVIVVRPHEPLMLADYQRILSGLLVKLHAKWTKR